MTDSLIFDNHNPTSFATIRRMPPASLHLRKQMLHASRNTLHKERADSRSFFR
ncbi:MAG: hypothetical protein JW715_03915 [Sedimentisphaerales bacterium]|nr:hypothetical protein [Sedimentisphaerales bacterium]